MKISQDQVKHLKPILQKLIIEIKKEILDTAKYNQTKESV